jgi:mannose-6-phosphate isomerase-like protein (cupin superfamily)
MGTLIKNFFSFKNKIDFNFLSNLLDDNNFESLISSNCTQNFVFDSVFKIAKVEEDYYFKDIYNVLNNTYNIENRKTDLFIFFSLVSGNKNKAHRDLYDVYIIGLYGKTMYTIEGEEFVVEPGDLLKIPKNKLHKAISLTPRICLSYGIY